jgi:hypothetical protein
VTARQRTAASCSAREAGTRGNDGKGGGDDASGAKRTPPDEASGGV